MANIYGELTRAQLENLTADPTLASQTAGRLWYRTDLSLIKVDLGGSADSLILSSNPVFTQISTPANPASGQNKLYFKSDNLLYQLTSAGIEKTVLRASMNVPVIQKFLLTSYYTFTVTAANATVGATYTNNAQTFTVIYTIAAGTTLVCSATGAPASSGTLTKSGGTGDSTITFASQVATGTWFPSSTTLTLLYIRVRMVGGGGGSGSAGTGGASGSTAGGNTTFGTTLLVANGGAAAVAQAGGAGGSASLGTGPVGIAISGGSGQDGEGTNTETQVTLHGGQGGSSFFGGAGTGKYSSNGGAAAANSGSGPGGAGLSGVATAVSGGGGGAGGFVDAIITSLLASYPFTVGGGGTGETGNTYAQGVSGPAGHLEVTEYYQ